MSKPHDPSERVEATAADAEVQAQYEAYPYPPRDPAEEAKRLIVGSPSHVLEIDHYVFGGAREFGGPFRALIAGGGTGDGAIMLAQQLADRGTDSELVYIDISAHAMAIARSRAEARGLTNVTFYQGSLHDVEALDLAPFHYIDCCGVLHHLDDPLAGLKSLYRALDPAGGIGLMLYGPFGRTGVYETQELIRLLAKNASDEGRLALARMLLEDLPPTNWFLRNPHLGDHRNAGDAGLYDLLLHSRDRAFSVPEIFALADSAGLAITGFIEPARYDPLNYLHEPALVAQLEALSWPEACAAAELIAGNMKRHICYLARKDRAADLPAQASSPGTIPVLRDADGAALAKRFATSSALSVDFDGVKIRLELPKLAGPIVELIDGRRTLQAIHGSLRAHGRKLGWRNFKQQFDQLYRALNGVNLLLLR